MTVKLLTEHHLDFLSFKGGYTGSSESTLVKMPHCWKFHDTAHLGLSEGFQVDLILIISARIVSCQSQQKSSAFPVC